VIETIHSQESERLAAKLQEIRNRNIALDDRLVSQVAAIIRDVRTRGDAALIDYAAQFDDCVMRAGSLRVSEEGYSVLRRKLICQSSRHCEKLFESTVPMDEALCRSIIDLSGHFYLVYKVKTTRWNNRQFLGRVGGTLLGFVGRDRAI
jgi:hypothetical protein